MCTVGELLPAAEGQPYVFDGATQPVLPPKLQEESMRMLASHDKEPCRARHMLQWCRHVFPLFRHHRDANPRKLETTSCQADMASPSVSRTAAAKTCIPYGWFCVLKHAGRPAGAGQAGKVEPIVTALVQLTSMFVVAVLHSSFACMVLTNVIFAPGAARSSDWDLGSVPS